ncbi:hypothetical protein [Microvirga sp. G4-2]|uniref:hypothetical protein n=1 Tax=Microvirga sp. G4-2 TaxID=3434467 RepID=UPI0040443980
MAERRKRGSKGPLIIGGGEDKEGGRTILREGAKRRPAEVPDVTKSHAIEMQTIG